MPSGMSKQLTELDPGSNNALNGGSGVSTIGGIINSVPAALNAVRGAADLPGDRIILGQSDALALSDTSVGTLYGGVYQYVRTKSGSTAAPTKFHAAFRDVTVTTHQVTPDEPGGSNNNFWAGFYISTLTKAYYGWIIIAGKAKVLFTTPLSGPIPAVGSACFIAGDTNGAVDTFDGNGNAPTFSDIGNLNALYCGIAETAPAAATASIIDIPFNRVIHW